MKTIRELTLKDKKILIIGGTGSLGQTLVRHLHKANQIWILSRDETKQWMMQNKYLGHQNINYYVCDIRDYEGLKKAILYIKPEIIINASAIKQIPVCETFPFESIKTNIIGIENLINICIHYHSPETVLGVSTDKACKPINVYGMCKAIGERLYLSANGGYTKFLCVRYGNVLESRGSIIPLFKYHARTDKAYYLTHLEMTRFFISLDESVQLIVTAIFLGKQGDIFVPVVKSGRIKDLIEIFIEKYGGEQKVIGIRSGEKIHEELINEDEMRRTFELDDQYLIIRPNSINNNPPLDRYSSDLCLLTKEQLREYLERNNVFDKEFETYREDEVRF